MIIRLDSEEKQTFQDVAEVSGTPLSSWARAKLRQSRSPRRVIQKRLSGNYARSNF